MILLCIVTIFSKSTTANADDRYVKLCERYFTEFAEDYGKFGQKDGFTYLYSDKKNTATIVAIPMEQKKVAVPEKINGKTVTKIELMDVFSCSSNYYFRDEFYGEHEDNPVPKVEYLSIPKTVKVINIYAGIGLTEGYCGELQSYLVHLKKFNVASGNKWYRSYKGVLYTKNGKKLITVPRKYTAKTVKVKKGTTKIADFAFSFCTNIKKVILPDTVKVIEQNAFECCSLNYITVASPSAFPVASTAVFWPPSAPASCLPARYSFTSPRHSSARPSRLRLSVPLTGKPKKGRILSSLCSTFQSISCSSPK